MGLLPPQGELRVQRAAPQQHHVPHGPAERLADEAVEEEVDGCVEHGQHVGQVVDQVDAPVPVNRRHVQVVDDHHRPGSPQHGEGGGDGQQHGRGLSQAAGRGRLGPALFPAALLSLPDPQRVDDQRVEDQKDAAGQEVDDDDVGPDKDGVQCCWRVAVPPHVRPPEEGQARRQRQHQDRRDDPPGPGRVADLPVEEGVAKRHVAVHGEGDGGPDGGVVGGKLGGADRV